MRENDTTSQNQPDVWALAKKLTPSILGGNANALYSPVCIFEGLRAMKLGAKENTLEELDELTEESGASSNSAYGLLPAEGLDAYHEYQAKIATGVWVDTKATPTDEFVHACSENALALSRVSFADKNAGEEVSRWISTQTNGLLKPPISFDPQMTACVVSALYLKDAWKHQFDKADTEHGVFLAESGETEVSYMSTSRTLEVQDTAAGTLVSYALSNEARMLFLLPDEGVSAAELLKNGAALDAFKNFAPQSELVELYIPKFTCETTDVNLDQSFIRAGFKSATAPNLELMTGSRDNLASYVHGAKLTIDEDGLEAGAYFYMVSVGGLPPFFDEKPKARVIRFDRPFLYAVVSASGDPLFLGSVFEGE